MPKRKKKTQQQTPTQPSPEPKADDRLKQLLVALAAGFLGAAIKTPFVPASVFGGAALLLVLIAVFWTWIFALKWRQAATALIVVAYIVGAGWWILSLPADESHSSVQIIPSNLTNEGNTVATGKTLNLNIAFFNPGPSKAIAAISFAKAYVLPANVVNGVSDVLDRAEGRFQNEMGEPAEQDYRAGRLVGLDIPPAQYRFTTAITPPLTENDVKAIGEKQFDPMVVFVAKALWRDELGRVGETYSCMFLQPNSIGSSQVTFGMCPPRRGPVNLKEIGAAK